MTDLAGKVALVTGGSKGLGLAIARALSAGGARVVAASRYAEPSGYEIDGVISDRVDVANPESVRALIDRAATALGGLHIAVANAGISEDGRIARMSDDKWTRTIGTNLSGTFHTLRAAAALMEPQGEGRIVTVSSCMASHPAVGTGAYAATKAAIVALTRVAALELGPRGILVNCISPGILDDGMGAVVASNPHLWETYQRHLALRRTGKVEEVGRFVAALVGPNSGYINGATIEIDGGIDPWA